MQDEFGETPLHAASGKRHVNVITILVERGAVVNFLNKVSVVGCIQSVDWTGGLD